MKADTVSDYMNTYWSPSSASFDLKDKTFLVAGAAGFVPSHVCEFYLRQGATVIGLDNFITGSKENITLLKAYDRFHFYECNIYEGLPDFRSTAIDYVLSLASPASPIDFAKIPMEIMRVNSEGTLALLQLAREKKARFLEASTSEVYGDPEVHPQPETYVGHVNPIGPRSCYDESKRFAEALTMSAHRLWSLETRIVRIFNTYGPRMRPDDGRVIPNFIHQALNNSPITVYGNGHQTRSFCFVTDLVQAMDCVLFGSDPTPINIGNPDEYSITEAAKVVIDVLGSSSSLSFKELPEDDPKQRRPDLSKLKKMSDYSPRVEFRRGLKETALFFQKQSSLHR
jgi:dTDP-glucose 4,6-dehydratase